MGNKNELISYEERELTLDRLREIRTVSTQRLLKDRTCGYGGALILAFKGIYDGSDPYKFNTIEELQDAKDIGIARPLAFRPDVHLRLMRTNETYQARFKRFEAARKHLKDMFNMLQRDTKEKEYGDLEWSIEAIGHTLACLPYVPNLIFQAYALTIKNLNYARTNKMLKGMGTKKALPAPECANQAA